MGTHLHSCNRCCCGLALLQACQRGQKLYPGAVELGQLQGWLAFYFACLATLLQVANPSGKAGEAFVCASIHDGGATFCCLRLVLVLPEIGPLPACYTNTVQQLWWHKARKLMSRQVGRRAARQAAGRAGRRAGPSYSPVCPHCDVTPGHGGSAVAEWLEQHLSAVVQQHWNAAQPEQSLTDAFLAADSKLLSKKAGFMGLGERGVGGSKCGATSALALMFADPANPGQTQLLTGNIGDARIVLVRGGQPVQLTVDHVPDDANERKRIEKFNPNPRMPLVRYVGGTWRVGGLLALSRAFGDAYLKGSLQFEGIVEGSDGYSSGFGVIAEPFTSLQPLTTSQQPLAWALWQVRTPGWCWPVTASSLKKLVGEGVAWTTQGWLGCCRWAIGQLTCWSAVAPDHSGLLLCMVWLQAAGPKASCKELAKALAARAVELGSTDDVTVTVMRLGPRA
ncbi:hypothetical protein QJQ45_019715 [Haematococcus lacustris]|nr:hypothetical protein QJQ45_019715 [Haematococcus lacustris]